MNMNTRAERIKRAAGLTPVATPEPAPPSSAGPAAAGTEGLPEMMKEYKELDTRATQLARKERQASSALIATSVAEARTAAEAAQKEATEELERTKKRMRELAELIRAEEAKRTGEDKQQQAGAVEKDEEFPIDDDPPAMRRPKPVRVGGVLPSGQQPASRTKSPDRKKTRLARLANIPELQDYAAFLNVLRSRVKLLVKLFDEGDMEAAADAWSGTKETEGWDGPHMEVLPGVKNGYPYRAVRLWLERYRLFPDQLAAAFVSVLSSIDRLRKAQHKRPLSFWDLVADPHLSTFAKWIGHQHLHDAQLANQWGGRSEGHVALAMSTRDALSYFEALP